MYIKLNFNTAMTAKGMWRLLTDIVNTSSVTSIAQLQARAAAASYNGALNIPNLDVDNSEIIRTVDPVNTQMHIAVPGTQDYAWDCMIQQRVHDDPTTYYYGHMQSSTENGANDDDQAKFNVGTAVTSSGGNIAAAGQLAPSLSNADDYRGTDINLTGQTYTGINYHHHDANGLGHNIYAIKAYITDECFLWSIYGGSGTGSSGYGTTFNNGDYYSGLRGMMQYRRYDHFNNPANGIIPMCWIQDMDDLARCGFGRNEHWIATVNTNSTLTTRAPFRAMNIVNASHRIGSSYPIEYFPHVAHMIGMRSYEQMHADYETRDGSGAGDLSVGKVIDSRANYRHPNSNLNANGYGLFPLGWTNTTKGNMGGNFTDLNNVYIFNGDYQPGDEIAVGEKLYSLWPGYVGYTNRFAIAIPKE